MYLGLYLGLELALKLALKDRTGLTGLPVHAVVGLTLVATHHVELARREAEVDGRHRRHICPARQRDIAHLAEQHSSLRSSHARSHIRVLTRRHVRKHESSSARVCVTLTQNYAGALAFLVYSWRAVSGK